MFLVDLDNADNSLRCIYVYDNVYTTFPKEIKELLVINNNNCVYNLYRTLCVL